jgi:hypothetical protein
MKLIKTLLILSFSSIIFLTMACEDNNAEDPAPESATISGTMTFVGDWPVDGTIGISLSSNWPPQGAPAASLVLDASSDNTYTFENVAFGTYAAIAVSWLDPNDTNSATNQSTLGAYGGESPFFTAYGGTDPIVVTVSEMEYELTGLDFDVDLVLAQP